MKLVRPKYSVGMLTILFFLSTFALKAQIITTVAGNGTGGYSGDGGAADSATLSSPFGIAVDAVGNIYIADFYNNVIRKVSISGVISTIAGNRTVGYSGDGGAATSASLNHPDGVAVDAVGNIYIADYSNNRIRKVNASGVISTVAGNGTQGYSGDGGAATSASIATPHAVGVDTAGNIYIADNGNSRIRKVNTSGVISTVAGNGNYGYSGDGGAATSAGLDPFGIAVDAAGNMYVADYWNNRIRKVNTNGVISTVAGNGNYGYSGDGGAATSASLSRPIGVAVDAAGNIYIADNGNNRIRKVDTSGVISTVAGDSTQGYSGDGGIATSASLFNPYGVAVNATGNIYIADTRNNVIRKVSTGILPVTLASFTATANNKTIVTNWQTATEINTSHFNIQRSTNGTAFKTIGNVKAKGAGNYSLSDPTAYSPLGVGGLEVLYYRLEIVDNDGAITYSKVVSVQLIVNSNQLSVYPNPARSSVIVSGNHIASVQVIDNLGRLVKTVSLRDATNPTLSVSGLAAGVYHLRVLTTDGTVSGVSLVVSD